MKRTLMILALGLTTACGGGGGGSDSSNFVGAYSVRMVATDNSCTFQADPYNAVYSVNQDGARVIVESNSFDGDLIYEGSTTSDNTFVVSSVGTQACVDDNGNKHQESQSQYTAQLSVSVDSDDSVRFVRSTDLGDCSGDAFNRACEYTMQGTGEKFCDTPCEGAFCFCPFPGE